MAEMSAVGVKNSNLEQPYDQNNGTPGRKTMSEHALMYQIL